MRIDGKTKVYGIFGWPVEHTASPALHNAAFEHLGINACYVPFPVETVDLEKAVEGIRAAGVCGVNVTVPHKMEILRYLDEVKDSAVRLRAANVVVNRDGVLLGYNTDAEGFRRALEHAGVEAADQDVVVLGAGGAARSVVRAFQKAGVTSIALFNRTREKAVLLAEEFSGFGAPIDVWSFSDPDVDTLFENSMILVNATSLGLRDGDPLPLEGKYIRQKHTLIDLIYEPRETRFLATGRERGALTINGYGMLVFQAMEAFTLWTGEKPPLKVMWDAGLEKL